jgi:hypothetical protein
MKNRYLLAVLPPLGLAGCAGQLNSVVFVTDTSLGINLDETPAIVSIAYDRTEGYIAPRYSNGALPPIVASIQTGGNIFSPQIRQVYATGAAALKAAGTANVATGPATLSGDKALIFFGTTTTIGLKAGFTDGTPLPSSLVVGYKRKEFSYIPLGSQTVANGTEDVYPSVLASIDTTIGATSLPATGLTVQQFFATGQAAETLAASAGVQSAFKSISNESVTATLSASEKQTAMAAAVEDNQNLNALLKKVMADIAPGGTLDPQKLKDLVTAANTKVAGSIPADVANLTTAAAVQTRIQDDDTMVKSLADALPQS